MNAIKDNFSQELFDIKQDALKDLSKNDYFHLRKIIFLNRIFLLIGFGTAWFIPNPLSMLCISIALHGQWTIVAHHVLHGGYDKVPHIPKRYTTKYFAVGWRRWIDWFDWIYPPAWKYEHNVLHHFYTNETIDPDMYFYRLVSYPSAPFWMNASLLVYVTMTWKAMYYSKNTLKAFQEKKNYDLTSFNKYAKKSYLYNYLPYLSFHFFIVPLLFFPLGWKAVLFVFINRIGAEIFTNIHSFFTIVPNHTAHDIDLQPTHFKSSREFFVNQINSTCNYNTGGFWRDYLQGYLNYQIEHHLFPDLPVSQYVKLQPKIKLLCEKYGIIYKQAPIWSRAIKMVRVFIRIDDMKPLKKSACD